MTTWDVARITSFLLFRSILLFMTSDQHTVIVWKDGIKHTLHAPTGANLRQTLLAADLSPYTRYTRRLNCGGRGLCATCGVWLAEENAPPPDHWHDKAADRFGYPRLSCQIAITADLTVYFVDKQIWGNNKTRQQDIAG